MEVLIINENFHVYRDDVESLFEIDLDNVTRNEYNDIIYKCENNGWDKWKNGWKKWIQEGVIILN